ncbi:MAG: hypothetical protein ABEJ79_07360 [Halolamina sp.]
MCDSEARTQFAASAHLVPLSEPTVSVREARRTPRTADLPTAVRDVVGEVA